jgi:beta-ribofuranosylaminobenzene 5'-phosphate synthase
VPISNRSVQSTLYECVYGIVAAALEQNEEVFWSAISRIQELEWKRKEWSLYGQPLKRLKKRIVGWGAKVVGMSSLGPSLFFFGGDIDKIVKNGKDLEPGCSWIDTTIVNQGRRKSVK